jgi:hypothetical protein
VSALSKLQKNQISWSLRIFYKTVGILFYPHSTNTKAAQ